MIFRNTISACIMLFLASCSYTESTKQDPLQTTPFTTKSNSEAKPPEKKVTYFKAEKSKKVIPKKETAQLDKQEYKKPKEKLREQNQTKHLDPKTLLGLHAVNADNLLGSPDLVRLEEPAEIRLYRHINNICTLHIFLYPKNTSATDRTIEYIEARNTKGRITGPKLINCFNALIKSAKFS